MENAKLLHSNYVNNPEIFVPIFVKPYIKWIGDLRGYPFLEKAIKQARDGVKIVSEVSKHSPKAFKIHVVEGNYVSPSISVDISKPNSKRNKFVAEQLAKRLESYN